jgi:hypothetical protein
MHLRIEIRHLKLPTGALQPVGPALADRLGRGSSASPADDLDVGG